MKITELTQAHKNLLPHVVDQWISYSSTNASYEEVSQAVEEIYKFAGREKPLVIMADSPLSALIICEILSNSKVLLESIRTNLSQKIVSACIHRLNDVYFESVDHKTHSEVSDDLSAFNESFQEFYSAVNLSASKDQSLNIKPILDSLLDFILFPVLRNGLENKAYAEMVRYIWPGINPHLRELGESIRSEIHTILRQKLIPKLWKDSYFESDLCTVVESALLSSLNDSLGRSLGESIHDEVCETLRTKLNFELMEKINPHAFPSIRVALIPSFDNPIEKNLHEALESSLTKIAQLLQTELLDSLPLDLHSLEESTGRSLDTSLGVSLGEGIESQLEQSIKTEFFDLCWKFMDRLSEQYLDSIKHLDRVLRETLIPSLDGSLAGDLGRSIESQPKQPIDRSEFFSLFWKFADAVSDQQVESVKPQDRMDVESSLLPSLNVFFNDYLRPLIIQANLSELQNLSDLEFRAKFLDVFDEQFFSELNESLEIDIEHFIKVAVTRGLSTHWKEALSTSIKDLIDSDNFLSNLRNWFSKGVFTYWWKYWAALYDFSSQIGVEFPQQELSCFLNFLSKVDFIIPFEGVAIVSRNPQINWQEFPLTGRIDPMPTGRILHCEDGPAVAYSDGFKVWAIEGVLVDEQIVMSPETQTIEQIEQEDNEEVKRIRLNRFGWHRYLQEAEAHVLDVSMPSETHRWMEALLKTKDGLVVLTTYDPSTGRPYALEVNPECQTCEEAQAYLFGAEVFQSDLGMGVGQLETYPIVRT